jgi:23S rRNA pseudouridine955/2504/2580 synthase
MKKIQIKLKKNTKISDFLLNYGFSYGEIQKLFKKKDIRIDNVKLSQDEYVMANQELVVFCEEEPKRRFEIFYEDDNIAIINKAQEIEVQGENSIEEQTGFYACHRIDRNTKGLVIFAKNKEAESEMLSAIKQRMVQKKYLAEVVGKTDFKGEKYEAYLLKDNTKAQVKIFKNYVKGSVKIETIFKTLKSNQTSSMVEAELITGKTHQIRAHLSYLGHAIIGDGKYGKNEDNKRFKERYQNLTCYFLKLNGLGEKLSYLNGKIFEIKDKK